MTGPDPQSPPPADDPDEEVGTSAEDGEAAAAGDTARGAEAAPAADEPADAATAGAETVAAEPADPIGAATAPWLSLDDDEAVLWSGRPRIQVLLWLAVPALVLPILIVVLWQSVAGVVLGWLLWGAVVAAGYLYLTNVAYVVSTRYAYAKRGVLGRRVIQIGLHNVQDTTLRQGAIGRWLDYGTVSFSTAGGEGATLAFHAVDDPGAVKRAVDERASRGGRPLHHEAAGGADRPAGERGGPDVDVLLAEARSMGTVARRLRRTLERGEDA